MRLPIILIIFLSFICNSAWAEDIGCVECAFAASSPGSSGMGMGGGGFMFQNQMFDESGNIKDSPENVSSVAMSIGFNFYGGSNRVDPQEVSANERLNSLLDQYKLNEPENYDLRDRILSEAAMNLAQREMAMNGGAYDLSVEYVSTDALNIFENAIESSGISTPSGMYSAQNLKEIVDNAGDDHQAYINGIDDQFYGEEKQKLLMNGMMRFDLDGESRKEFIAKIIEGEVNQDFLSMLLAQEMNARNGMGGIETPGLLDLISEHIDFSQESGFSKENILCQNLAPSFYYTEMGKAQAEEAMGSYGMGVMGGFPGSGIGVGGGGFGSYNGSEDETSEEYITPEPFPGDDSYSYQPTMSIEEYKEKMMKNTHRTSQKNVALLLSLGADANIICKDGMSAADKIRMLENEGQFEEDISSLHNPKSSQTGAPCIGHLDDSDFVGLCDTVSILATLENNLRKNERTRDKGSSSNKLHNIYGEGTSKCNFLLLDEMMSFGGFPLGRDIQLEISPNGSNRTFVIQGNNKEEFLKKLNSLIE